MKSAKKTCSHINSDGTFIGGFDGCVAHQMECEGLAKDNAEKLCAYIGRRAGKIPGAKSFDDIRNAIETKIIPPPVPRPDIWIVDMFMDHAIISRDGKYFKLPFTIHPSAGSGDEIKFGTEVEVEKDWIPVEIIEAARKKHDDDMARFKDAVKISSSLKLKAASDSASKGYKWSIQIVEAGIDLQNSIMYPFEVLKAAVPLYEGAKVFALSQGQHANPGNPYGKSVRDLVGWVSGVTSNDRGLGGMLNILKNASWLRDMLVDAFEQGKGNLVGLSHDIWGKVEPGSAPAKVKEIVRVDSVDIVYDPIAGGKFLRMAAAHRKSEGQKEANMFKELLAALKGKRPDLKDQIEALEAKGDALTQEEVIQLVAAASEKPGIEELLAGISDLTSKQAKDFVEQAQKKLDDAVRLNACSRMLIDELHESGLPDIMKERIRKRFQDRAFEPTELQAAIKEEKEVVDKLTGSGTPHGVGGLRTEVGPGEPEKLQAALDKLFDLEVDEKYKDVPAFRSLRAAYTRLTGDAEMRGIPTREGIKLGEAFMQMMRLPAAYSSTSFTYVLGNSMYRRLIKEYRAVNYQEDALISYRRNAENFKTLEIIQVGYLGDVPDVTPETADYAELTMPTDIEASYAINQKGWILTVTRKVILNDDLRSVAQLVSKMGRAHRRTHAKRAWNKIIDNATFDGDSKALFHADHANLGATTLTNDATGIATLTAALKAMYAQTEQDSGAGLALEPRYMWVPRDILEIAKALNSVWVVTANNPHAARFGQNHERIICNPLFIDPNDWGLIADPGDVDLLEAGYLNGRTEPEFFVADNPTVGQMFVADKIQYKSRHEYEFEIADYRGLWKAVVT